MHTHIYILHYCLPWDKILWIIKYVNILKSIFLSIKTCSIFQQVAHYRCLRKWIIEDEGESFFITRGFSPWILRHVLEQNIILNKAFTNKISNQCHKKMRKISSKIIKANFTILYHVNATIILKYQETKLEKENISYFLT